MSILLATTDRELEERCRRAASADYSIEVVKDLAALHARIGAAQPEIVLIDGEIVPRPREHDVGRVVNAVGAGRVIVLTTEFNEDEEVALLRCGVKGCCRRGVDPESLRQVLSVTQSGVWVTRSLLPRLVTELRRFAQQSTAPAGASGTVSSPATDARGATPVKPPSVLDRLPPEKLSSLTRREQEIVKLIADGATNKEVGIELDISDRTVKGHLSNIFLKLGTPDRVKLMLYLQDQRPSARVNSTKQQD